jgi:hypothetical protein
VIPPSKAIQAPTTEIVPTPPARQVPQIAAAPPDVVPDPSRPLFAEAVPEESMQPEPRKSAFKKKRGAVPVETRDWDESRLVD